MSPLLQKFSPTLSRIPSILLCSIIMYGCANNPVTGKKELSLIPQSQEIYIGESNYSYMQQSQGGTYNSSPELSALVTHVGNKLASVSDRQDLPYEFVIVNDGTPNAWAMPGGKIAIHRGLLTQLESEAELAAVLSHEITHAAAKHTAKAMQRQILLTAGLAGTAIALSGDDEEDDKNKVRNDAILIAASVAGNLMMHRYSRAHELEADHYGMVYMERAGYNPQAAVSLQETFVKLQDGKKPNWLAGLFASHPPSQDRVIANRNFANTLAQHHYDGKEKYQKALVALKQQQPAYDAYDEANRLLKKGNHKQALIEINKAIKVHPKESLFYGLQGDIFAKQNLQSKALKAYQSAISINPDYYYPYLKRGLLYQAMGKNTLSKIDLEKAQVMMPTENAKAALASMSA